MQPTSAHYTSDRHTLILLVNLGTPLNPGKSAVRRYLTEFLNDPRVIDLPWLGRKLLVNGIIVPFRAGKSSAIYRQVWTEEGSPLLLYGEQLAAKLQVQVGDKADVKLAMRYQQPSLEKVLNGVKYSNYKQLIIFPLYPQYASSTTGSTYEEIMRIVSRWWVIPEMHFIGQYFRDKAYQDALKATASEYDPAHYDHVLMSFHGLPERQVDKVYAEGLCSDRDCEKEYNRDNRYCYKAACYETARLLADNLGLSKEHYTVCFQSRLGKKWLEPFTEDVIKKRAATGDKRLLAFAPAFTADCLETSVEIGVEYDELFRELGGETLQLVPSLNDSDPWVQGIAQILSRYLD